ncbi:MAG: hypothetical protein U0163_20555 [Gemmatimonadaceae bacterium]
MSRAWSKWAVLLNVEAYESMLDELALLRDVRVAEEQVAAGNGASHRVAKKLPRLTQAVIGL